MTGGHDLVFVGVKSGSHERIEGELFIAATGKRYKAVSGTNLRLPLPNGAYVATTLRTRARSEMARDVPPAENGGGGLCFPGWSADLEALFCTERTYLRIHPDGNVPGTLGCIGITEAVHNCYEDLKQAFAAKKELVLLVSHNSNDPKLNKKQAV